MRCQIDQKFLFGLDEGPTVCGANELPITMDFALKRARIKQGFERDETTHSYFLNFDKWILIVLHQALKLAIASTTYCFYYNYNNNQWNNDEVLLTGSEYLWSSYYSSSNIF